MSLLALEQVLSEFRPDPESSRPLTVQKAIFLARRLQERAKELQTPPERRQQAELDRMLQTPSDKVTLALMTDQAFRTHDAGVFRGLICRPWGEASTDRIMEDSSGSSDVSESECRVCRLKSGSMFQP